MKSSAISTGVAIMLCCLWSSTLTAQIVKGKVMSASGEALPFSNVAFISLADSSLVIGTTTNTNGAFQLEHENSTPQLPLLLRVSAMGFQTRYYSPDAIPDTIVLTEHEQLLTTAVVKAKRPSVQFSHGKLKVGIAHTLLAHTGDALQVLSHLPFVSRSNNGVSVFGRGTPLVYIDHRIVKNTEELNQLHSDEIKNIEIDLHPGASYDSNVKAVIKITTLRKEEGLSTYLTAEATQMHHFNSWAFGKLNYRLNKWDFFTSVSAQQSRMKNDLNNRIAFEHQQDWLSIDQSFNNELKSKKISLTTGLNYSNPQKQEWGIKYDFTRLPSGSSLSNGSSTIYEQQTIKKMEQNTLLDHTTATTHALNGYLLHTWTNNYHLSINADYLQGNNRTYYDSYLDNHQKVKTTNLTDYQLYTAKVEMNQPLWQGTFTYGVEGTYTNNTRHYHATQNIGTALLESDDENKQNLGALFMSQANSWGDWTLELGGRLEYADYKYYHHKKLQHDVSKHYTKILPYLQLDYDKNDISLSLGYSTTIHRPSYGDLNSSLRYIDEYSYTSGNPFLQAAYDHILDLTVQWKDVMLDITHTWYENSIMKTYQKQAQEAAVLVSLTNIPHYREWSGTLSYSPTIHFWRPKIETNLFLQDLHYNHQSYNRPSFAYEWDNLFRLSSHLNLSFDLWGTASGDLYTTSFQPTFRSDLSLNASFLQDRLSLWLKISDLFHTDKERWHTFMNGVSFYKKQWRDTRGIQLQLSYNLNPKRSKYRGATTTSEAMRLP